MIVEKRIRALCDFEFSTCVTAKSFIEGEVDIIPFKDEKSFQELLAFGRFEEVNASVPVGRPAIPVLLPSPTAEETPGALPAPLPEEKDSKVELTGNLGKLDLQSIEPDDGKEGLIEGFGLTEEKEEAIVDAVKEETEKLPEELHTLEPDDGYIDSIPVDASEANQASEPEEPPHPYLCVQHGGSSACEEANKVNGFTCPKCTQENSEVPTVEELQSILDGPEVPIETKSDGSIGPVEE